MVPPKDEEKPPVQPCDSWSRNKGDEMVWIHRLLHFADQGGASGTAVGNRPANRFFSELVRKVFFVAQLPYHWYRYLPFDAATDS